MVIVISTNKVHVLILFAPKPTSAITLRKSGVLCRGSLVAVEGSNKYLLREYYCTLAAAS